MATSDIGAPGLETTEFYKCLNKLYDTRRDDENTDFTLFHGDKHSRIHSFVLCTRSKVFAKMCKGPWKEAEAKEINLPDDNFSMICRLLHHCYLYNYSSGPLEFDAISEAETTHVSELHTNVQMYALAEKYEMADLKKEALTKFTHYMKGSPPKTLAASFQTVLKAIPAIYDTTPGSDRSLRDLVVTYGVERWADFPKVEDLQDSLPTQFVIDVSEKLFYKPTEIVEKIGYDKPCGRCGSKDSYKVNEVVCKCGRWEKL